ncbi:hypothetical protein T10_4649 [Trichinella papuae]|uniref:Uncharacterized protein n=1 Tax=Trichinella papuae TaxID=268474 RepID=A0A0V1N0J3_9BILA|nr:hypothetical protein T10_4649 [Trichinella papuae]
MLCGLIEDDPVTVKILLGWMICEPPSTSPSRFAVSAACASVDAKSSCEILRKFRILQSLRNRLETEGAQPDQARKKFERTLSYDGVPWCAV